ncbi:MAG: hypothetical protein OYL97_02145 [Candidatus Poribacteria bacterium]|nr:hypothetical protein [Candidatus Poribacteria bacterium]
MAILSRATKKPLPMPRKLTKRTVEPFTFSETESTGGVIGFSETICCGVGHTRKENPVLVKRI